MIVSPAGGLRNEAAQVCPVCLLEFDACHIHTRLPFLSICCWPAPPSQLSIYSSLSICHRLGFFVHLTDLAAGQPACISSCRTALLRISDLSIQLTLFETCPRPTQQSQTLHNQKFSTYTKKRLLVLRRLQNDPSQQQQLLQKHQKVTCYSCSTSPPRCFSQTSNPAYVANSTSSPAIHGRSNQVGP